MCAAHAPRSSTIVCASLFVALLLLQRLQAWIAIPRTEGVYWSRGGNASSCTFRNSFGQRHAVFLTLVVALRSAARLRRCCLSAAGGRRSLRSSAADDVLPSQPLGAGVRRPEPYAIAMERLPTGARRNTVRLGGSSSKRATCIRRCEAAFPQVAGGVLPVPHNSPPRTAAARAHA